MRAGNGEMAAGGAGGAAAAETGGLDGPQTRTTGASVVEFCRWRTATRLAGGVSAGGGGAGKPLGMAECQSLGGAQGLGADSIVRAAAECEHRQRQRHTSCSGEEQDTGAKFDIWQ